MREEGIILFLRYSEEGNVKTRISAELGERLTASLYRRFVADIIEKLEMVEADSFIYFDPPGRAVEMREWLGAGMLLCPQRGDDLGQRMKRAFQEQFDKSYKRLILIGSDIPHIPITIVKDAIAELKEYPAVIGPALDGGYYLIGFESRHFLPQVFDSIEWSTSSVFSETMALFKYFGINTAKLPEMRDIDTLNDLKAVLRENGSEKMPESALFWDEITGGSYGS